MDSEKATKKTFIKKRNEIIDFEAVNTETDYAITINPCDKHQFFKDNHRIGTFMEDIHRILYNSSKVYKYRLYLEVSPKGRLHWHGYIKIKDPIQFYLYSVPHMLALSTVVIKPIDDSEVWYNYCNKQLVLHTECLSNHFTKMPVTNDI